MCLPTNRKLENVDLKWKRVWAPTLSWKRREGSRTSLPKSTICLISAEETKVRQNREKIAQLSQEIDSSALVSSIILRPAPRVPSYHSNLLCKKPVLQKLAFSIKSVKNQWVSMRSDSRRLRWVNIITKLVVPSKTCEMTSKMQMKMDFLISNESEHSLNMKIIQIWLRWDLVIPFRKQTVWIVQLQISRSVEPTNRSKKKEN